MSSALVFLSVRLAKRAFVSLASPAAGLISGPHLRRPLAVATHFATHFAQQNQSGPSVRRDLQAQPPLGHFFCATASRLSILRSLLTAAGRVREPHTACRNADVRRPGGEKTKIIGRNWL